MKKVYGGRKLIKYLIYRMLESVKMEKDARIHCVGIKGTGISALAQTLAKRGCAITGSDTAEKFPTEGPLIQAGIKYNEEFSEENIDSDIDLIIYSAAYTKDGNPELEKASKLFIPMINYPEALGALSKNSFSIGISGVNGKTTTTAMCAVIARACELPASVICGSGIASLNGSPVLCDGDKIFFAETCEYRNHFLNFFPDIVIITNVELDHTDFFPNFDSVLRSFIEYANRLPENGKLIYCEDNSGAKTVASRIAGIRPDLTLIPYGFNSEGDYSISKIKIENGEQSFNIGFSRDRIFRLKIPGSFNILNAVAAAAAARLSLEYIGKTPDEYIDRIARGLYEFNGTKRRMEIYGEAGGILFIDDYGHHPTSISETLKGLKEFYSERRIIIDFMPHTYSRTKALLKDFAKAFQDADLVIINEIYASAREKTGPINGLVLCSAIKKYNENCLFLPDLESAAGFLKKKLKPGDLFISMGAGDNWKLCQQLFQYHLETA